jgi:hypothetical protein
MPNANIRDADMELLKLMADRTQQSQSETVSQALIMYAESLGLVKTKTRKIEVVKRSYELNASEDWGDQKPVSATINSH